MSHFGVFSTGFSDDYLILINALGGIPWVYEAPCQVLEDRVGRMADADAGVTLVDMDDVFSPDDLSLFAPDRIHPSEIGSARIARLITLKLERRE